MSEHYNAFISYKHAPEDNRVAEAVHKGLERFHIPSKIRKKTGKKRIHRIFRDKDELPITSDLSDTITKALADSDYLIVICSTNTKKSAWVPREIECFLKNHTKKEIFTVLVNGEPYDVIPEILQYEERVVKDENGNEQTVRIPSEPLSCDYRLPLRKAKKTELPRLACGLIGCAYDELMNRRRQYRLKQLTAVFLLALAVMGAFSGYMYYSRDRIRKTYLESLKNQSRYLANESENLFEKEQRITALQLALEALPKDDADERPVTAEAVRALTGATLAYESSDGKNIHAAWNYTMPNIIEDFQVSDDGKTIAIRDNGNVFGLWDTGDHKKIIYLEGEYRSIKGMRFLNDDCIAVWDEKKIDCYDVKTGNRLWDQTLESEEYDVFDDDDNIMLNGDSFYICTYQNDCLQFDIKTGRLIKKISLIEKSSPEELMLDNPNIVESRLSPDGKKIAFRALKGWNEYAYGVFDLDTKEVKISDYYEEMIKAIEWVDNDLFMVADTNVDMKGSMSFGNREILSNDHSTVKCIDARGLTEKWKADFVCNGVMIGSEFLKLEDSVAFYSGNVATVYDIKTGKEIYSNNVNDSIIDASDRDGDGSPLYITENGGYAAPAQTVNDDAVYFCPYFADDLRKAVVNKGVYAKQNLSHEIIYYGVNVYDEEWKPLCEDASFPEVPNRIYQDEDYLAVLSNDDDKKPVLDVFGLNGNGERFKKTLEGDGAYRYILYGIHDGSVVLGSDCDEACELVFWDIKEDKTRREKLPETISSLRNNSTLKDNKFVYSFRTDDYKTAVAVRDIDTGKENEIIMPDDISYIKNSPIYYEEINAVCLTGGDEDDFAADIETGETVKIETPDGWSGGSCFSDNSLDGLFAVSDGKQIVLADRKGCVKETIDCPGLTPLGMTFLNDDLMVLFNDGSLNSYSVETGEFKKNIDVLVYVYYSGGVNFEYDSDRKLLYIEMDDMCDMVDMENGIETAHIIDCYGHHKGRDIFITASKENGKDKKIGYYRHYSVQELIDKAHDILKDAELSEELRSRYGL